MLGQSRSGEITYIRWGERLLERVDGRVEYRLAKICVETGANLRKIKVFLYQSQW